MRNSKTLIFLKKVIKIISWTILITLLALATLLVIYVISYKIADKKDKFAPVSMFTVISKSMEPTIKVYDVLLIKKTNVEKLKVGDIITFYPSNNIFSKTTFTHRINSINYVNNNIQITTKGDANEREDGFIVYEKDILGKVILIIPSLGKIQTFIANDGVWLFAFLIPALAIISYDIVKIIKIFRDRKKNQEINSDF